MNHKKNDETWVMKRQTWVYVMGIYLDISHMNRFPKIDKLIIQRGGSITNDALALRLLGASLFGWWKFMIGGPEAFIFLG